MSVLVVGDMVTFPLPKVSTMVEGRVVLLGVTYINIQSRGGERENDETVKPTSLLCLCLSLTPAHCVWSAQHSSCPSPSISPMTGLNTISCVTTSPTPTPVKVSTIRQVTYRKSRQKQQMLEPVVHRVFTRHRRTEFAFSSETQRDSAT